MSDYEQTAPYLDPSSVGIVQPQTLIFDEPLTLECQQILPAFELVIETYGTLNTDKSNAILICHALSGSHHAAGYHSADDTKAGWWDNLIGNGKAIDTSKFFVVCLNNIGSCHGSTGPTTINPKTGKIYGADFPLITIKDWVKTQVMLSDRLEIKKWHAIVGGSMGGMQALQWSVDYPDRLSRCVIIASTPKLSAQNIAFNEVARQSILSDPEFHDGWYLERGTYPRRGLILARMVGHITYITEDAMKAKFGRDLKSGRFMYGYDVEFQVESYLRYQGERFSQNFDANTYLLMTKALDYFDPTRDYAPDGLSDEDALKLTLSRTRCQFLVISFTTDWRFSPERSVELVDALMANTKPVSFVNVDAPHGHDSFLFDIPRYRDALKGFLQAK
ncbi:homoserine O-acetyltransferase [Moraxella catarrhalis]|uniref:homoserine O-succinyltransferase MetX n=1 Tax=Moraxella catarrhalis TaxID=480 RepID=UPI0002029DCF|nr:homoserine O-acetyltransferase [Moraxella catarrhalis]AXT92963.1 homoserine acetyltransferase [Moraxella catarrhalis]EGE11341.1 homoserine O-acetyltransferase [Moraxella catarrhalis 7169]EGE14039.1 homoserine O-acetyltransferase [Moraxella catarrhalis 46P47B1]EGE14215.1 homoserine O-acetyltransferase [Moraxella catarrhalis 12P80B1]EGE17474.1 homoserine O-acetyltransferase [Moraxella catarrhalis BC1]